MVARLLALVLVPLMAGPGDDDSLKLKTPTAPDLRPLSVEEAVRLGLAHADAADPAARLAAARAVEQEYWGLWLAQARVRNLRGLARAAEDLARPGEGPDAPAEARAYLDRVGKQQAAATAEEDAAGLRLRRRLGLPEADDARLLATTDPGLDRAGDPAQAALADALEAGADALLERADDRRLDRRVSGLEAATAARMAAMARNRGVEPPADTPKPAAKAAPVDPSLKRAAAQARITEQRYARAARNRAVAARTLESIRADFEAGDAKLAHYLAAVERYAAAVDQEAEAQAHDRVAAALLAEADGTLLDRRATPAKPGPEPDAAPEPDADPDQAAAAPRPIRGRVVFGLGTGPACVAARFDGPHPGTAYTYGGPTLPFRFGLWVYDHPIPAAPPAPALH